MDHKSTQPIISVCLLRPFLGPLQRRGLPVFVLWMSSKSLKPPNIPRLSNRHHKFMERPLLKHGDFMSFHGIMSLFMGTSWEFPIARSDVAITIQAPPGPPRSENGVSLPARGNWKHLRAHGCGGLVSGMGPSAGNMVVLFVSSNVVVSF